MQQQAQTLSLPSCLISSLSGQLAESVSPCVETAPESPTNSLCALSKSYQTSCAVFSQQWKLPRAQMLIHYFNEFIINIMLIHLHHGLHYLKVV